MQIAELDDKGAAHRFPAKLPDHLYRRFHGSSGRQQIIDDDHALSRTDAVHMHFQRI